MSKKTPIPTEKNSEGFEIFINLENNRRIFFSAPFGMGKTYFLKEFSEEKNATYNFFPLYPVKYQMRNDLEMVEVIGSDLFIKLMEQHKESTTKVLKDEGKAIYLIKAFFRCTAALTRIGPTVVKEIENAYKNRTKQKSEEKIAEIQNSFFEELISKMLKNIKEKEGKKSVLILDDLDRLEPKHIFKILNAFSPSQDEEDNKFGFDIVIFIGDIDNIKKIFHHMYGDKTDFDGYIDKFFSFEPYRYNIETELQTMIVEIVRGYCHAEKDTHGNTTIAHNNHDINSVLTFILKYFIQTKKINLRNLFVLQNISPPDIKISPANSEGADVRVEIIRKILLHIFRNDKKKLLDTITEVRDIIPNETMSQDGNQNIENLKRFAECMLQFIDNEKGRRKKELNWQGKNFEKEFFNTLHNYISQSE